MKITNEIFEKIDDENIFASGVIENSPEGIYMTNNKQGSLLLWVAVKGYGGFWAIYVSWFNMVSIESCSRIGDKLTPELAKKCIDCDDKVFKKYRS